MYIKDFRFYLDDLAALDRLNKMGFLDSFMDRKLFIKKNCEHSETISIYKAKTFWEDWMHLLLPEELSHRILQFGFLDYDVSLFLLENLSEGSSFIDIGAHIGFYSRLASKIVQNSGSVISIEPTKMTFEILARNLADCANTKLINCAIADYNGRSQFRDYGGQYSAYNTIENVNRIVGREVDYEQYEVDVCMLTTLEEQNCNKPVDAIKIDAEGSERRIIESSESLFKKNKPKLIIEVGDYNTEEFLTYALLGLIRDLGYDIYRYDNRAWQKVKINRQKYEYENVFCL